MVPRYLDSTTHHITTDHCRPLHHPPPSPLRRRRRRPFLIFTYSTARTQTPVRSSCFVRRLPFRGHLRACHLYCTSTDRLQYHIIYDDKTRSQKKKLVASCPTPPASIIDTAAIGLLLLPSSPFLIEPSFGTGLNSSVVCRPSPPSAPTQPTSAASTGQLFHIIKINANLTGWPLVFVVVIVVVIHFT